MIECNPKLKSAKNKNYICNPKTGRWVKKDGKIGKQLLSSREKIPLKLKTSPKEKELQKNIQDLVTSISFEEYEHEEGSITEQYGTPTLVINTLIYFEKKYPKLLCIDQAIKELDLITWAMIGFVWNADEEKLIFWNVCPNTEKRFIAIPLTLEYGSIDGKKGNVDIFERTGHQNIILIDTKQNTVERFDPWGVRIDPKNKVYLLDNKIQEFYSRYKFIALPELCPEKSFQAVQTRQKLSKDNIGFCVGWSLFYLNLRLNIPM